MTAMTAMTLTPQLQLPWESSTQEDRRFSKILRTMLAALLALAIVIPLLPVPELTREQEEQLPPHLARVILEKKLLPESLPVPVTVPPRTKIEEPERKPVVEETVPAPVKAQEPVPQPLKALERARDEAAVAGVLAFRDDLAEMRDSLDLDTMPQTLASRGEASAAQVERSIITGAAATGSGGINTSTLSRDTGGAALSGRETTRVESAIAGAAREAGQSRSAQLGGRNDESIRQAMDRNKGAIFAIYNRALRKDPLLQGKLVFEMQIEASGEISGIKLLSSELADPELTRKILARIRMIRFEPDQVLTTRVNYSFDFLPYA